MHRGYKEGVKLKTKITALSLIIVSISILIVSIFTRRIMEENIEREVESNVINIARTVAKIPNVIKAFEEEDPSLVIQPIVENIRLATRVEYIVITNLEGIRYSHPEPNRIGQRFMGGDDGPALLEGKEYISSALVPLGWSTRAFTPIYNYEGKRMGMVSVGVLNESIENSKEQITEQIRISILLGIFIGLIGSMLLAKNIKTSLMGLEPAQVVKLFTERNAILEAVREGIIAIDAQGDITLINQAAKEILNLDSKDIVGLSIEQVLPETKMNIVLKSGIAHYDIQQIVNGTVIIINKIPILDNGKIVGVIASFRTKTEIAQLAEELTGARMLVDSLRANTHEFMNKMHVVLGLIGLGEYVEAQKYIMDVAQSQQQINSFIVKKIKDPGIAALMLGKYTSGKERGIKVELNENSDIHKLSGKINSSAIITIMANLIENAFDSVKDNQCEKLIKVYIKEKPDNIVISIRDNGYGISRENIKKIFKRGFTTKEQGGGIGLFLVNQNVNSLGGKIRLRSKIGFGTHFIINLPKYK